jgi:hypothetical protein
VEEVVKLLYIYNVLSMNPFVSLKNAGIITSHPLQLETAHADVHEYERSNNEDIDIIASIST